MIVAEDSVLLREGIARLLSEHGFEVVGQAGDAEDLVRKVGAHKPDVAIVDIRMPPTNTDDGLRAALRIREEHPQTGVLVLSAYVEETYALELVADSASGLGYLLKDRVADVDGFVDSVRRVGNGGSALDPEVVSRLAVVGSALRTTPAEVPGRDKPVSQIRYLREHELAIGQDFPEVSKELANAPVPPVDHVAPDHREHRVPLHVRVELRQHSFGISVVGGVNRAFEGVDVLLRHRPRSISRVT